MVDRQLLETRRAFDGVAADYDGPSGNNEIVQWLRSVLHQTVVAAAPMNGRLLDLGCGTGLDLAYFASRGYSVLGIDSSTSMIQRSRDRIHADGFDRIASVVHLGIEDVAVLAPRTFDAIYSDLGALNCVPDLIALARACKRLSSPNGRLIFSVIGRVCPWEYLYYLFQGNLNRAQLRQRRGAVAVGLRNETVWTRYYSPNEFAKAFDSDFAVVAYRSLGLLTPPPYLIGVVRRLGGLAPCLTWVDDRIGSLPIARDAGDHFLMVLRPRLSREDNQ